MDAFILAFIVIVIIEAFYFWMFWDMYNSTNLPRCFVKFYGNDDNRKDWIIAFIVTNILAALYYYSRSR